MGRSVRLLGTVTHGGEHLAELIADDMPIVSLSSLSSSVADNNVVIRTEAHKRNYLSWLRCKRPSSN